MADNYYYSRSDVGYDTTTSIWSGWNTTATITASAITTTDSYSTVWYDWNTTSGTATAWTTWVTTPTVVEGSYSTISYGSASALTEEQIVVEQQRIQAAADRAMEERKVATTKAKTLLKSLLDEKQREQLERAQFFDFVSQTGRKMRIKQGHARNIDVLGEDGKRIQTLCAHPSQYGLVDEDHMVAQFLTLRHNENEFMRVANAS